MEAGNFSFFAPGDEPSYLQDLNLDEKGEPVRKRQRHTKSRHGCMNCKRRKVKCDETQPSCLNCRKRGLECNLLNVPKPHGRSPQRSPTYMSGNASQRCSLTLRKWTDDGLDHAPAAIIPSNVKLILRRSPAERELIQHFERFTSKVLTLSTSTWYSEVLNTALHCDYLMSAVMLVAASHINFYLPKNDPNRRPVLHHFVNALSGLRKALAEEITARIFEAIFGCSILLISHSWSYIDTDLGDGIDIAPHFRETVGLFHGLKDCVLACQNVFHKTYVAPIMLYSPRETLENYIREKKSSERDFIRTISHCLLCGLGRKCPKGWSADNVSALQRLSLCLHAIKLAQPDVEGSGIQYDIYRYLFTWPTLCTNGFVQQLKENHPASLLILLYYYAAILSVFSDKIWFMKDRALFMYRNLLEKLGGGCDMCTGPALALCRDSPIVDPMSWGDM